VAEEIVNEGQAERTLVMKPSIKIHFFAATTALVAALFWPATALGEGGRMLHLIDTPPNTFDESSRPLFQAERFEVEAAQQERLAAAQSLTPWTAVAPEAEEGPGCRIDPASPSVGADIPETYFGPAPSTVNSCFIGPHQLLTSGPVDQRAGTITLPLYRGVMRGDSANVWYILTDTTDQGNAEALGLNFAAKLNYAATDRGVRRAVLERDGLLVFNRGRVTFEPERRVEPSGPGVGFPPSVAEPGSFGNPGYTPLVKIVNAGGHVYDAPVIAFGVSAEEIDFPEGDPDYTLVHDKVVSIDMASETVTLRLTPGFSFARPVLYLSTEASLPDVAALEGATWAPSLMDIETGNDDSAFSAVERIFVTSNGPTGCENPQRQGLNSAILDGRGPFNVLGGIPTVATDYSPLWDVNLGEWTAEAIDSGYRARLNEEFQILTLVEAGFITGPGGTDYGSIGAIVNCPIVFRFL
jgi:hypothetical protein